MNINLRVKDLIKRHETRDPFRIAKELGIAIKFKPYEETKGYFIEVETNQFIVINSNLDHLSQKIVCAHELGHALLHSKNKQALKYEKGMSLIKDFTLFPSNSIYENEANQFAAQLLLHEELEQELLCVDEKAYEALVQLKNYQMEPLPI